MRGSIVKRGKNSWAVVVDLGRDQKTAKRRQKWFSHQTRREAEAHLAQILSAIQGGTWTPPSRIRLADYLERWLVDYAAGTVRPTTLDSYQMIIRRHLVPVLGHVPLDRLSPVAIQSYLTRKAQWQSASTVHKHAAVLHRALNHAVKWGLLNSNPCARVDAPRARHFEPKVWDEEQVRLFLAEAKRSSPHYCLYLAAILTGMRAGELAGARRADWDLTLASAHVKQTFYRLGGRQMWGEPKSAKSRRTVALPALLVEEVRQLRREQDERRRVLVGLYQDHDLIFCQADGKPLHMHNVVRRDFNCVIKRAGLPRIRFHDLRHSHATLLLAQGENLRVIS